MSVTRPDKDRIFNAAAEIVDAAEKGAFLDEACGNDPRLRAEIEDLLRHEQEMGSFLESPPPGLEVTADAARLSEKPSRVIGSYKLLQVIGEGGMGVVHMAEQTEPVRRRVALKIIKPGMDSRQVIARFEAERQALAMMDHPNIARVYDGGTTETGRPYFVMELVKGIAITDYCDQGQFSIRDRLRLFVTVCQAVQHAHQKGIIHRDLKPSNVLVTQADGEPVIKVIDFGVAKAVNQELTEKTLFTAFGQMIGTPQYMSPEQAEMNCLDVDTRSDIYSLGVLLYELLTGTTPLDGARLRSAGYAEIQRLIREEEPLKPSTRLSTSGRQLQTIARQRSSAPNGLQRLVRGDLDWIVMKTMEKDRNRRYETAVSLSADVQAFLDDKPVAARRPSITYRLGKFIRRNRVAFAISSVIACCIALMVLQFVAMYFRQAQLITELRTEAFRNALTAAMADQDNAGSLIQRAKNVGVSADKIAMLEGQHRLYRGYPGDAITCLEKAVHLKDTVMARGMLTVAYHFSGDLKKWADAAMEIRDLDQVARGELSAEDLLFWAQATCVLVDPDQVLIGMNASLEQGIYPLSLAVRAEASTWRAIHKATSEDAQRALEDIAAAEKMMPHNPYVLHTRILANYIADILADIRDENRKPLVDRVRMATEMADQINNHFPEYSHARVFAASYLDYLGETDKAIEQFEDLREKGPWYASFAAMTFYRHGRWDQARDEFLRMPPSPSKALIVPTMLDTEAGREKCRALYDCLVKDGKGGVSRFELEQAQIASIMLYLGDREEARYRAKSWLEDAPPGKRDSSAHTWGDFANSQLQYIAGEIGEEELLARAAWSKLTECEARRLIGATYLSIGRRNEAKESFRKAAVYPAYWFASCPISVGLLKRMEDPSWPDWIETSD